MNPKSSLPHATPSHPVEEQRLNDILEALPGYLVLLTPDYHVTFANRFFRERFGEAHGRRCYEYLFEHSQSCEVCETYKVLQTMEPGRWEWTGPDGHIYDVYDFPFRDTNGSTMILEMGMDVTEQKRTEAQLRELVLFPTLNPDGVLQVDKTGLIRKINPAAAQMGFSVGVHLTKVIPDLHELDLQACIAAGTTERVYETQLGERFLSWSVRGAPELGLAFLYSKDITARKQAMQELVRATELQNRFFDSIDVHIAYMDRNFNFIRVNNAYAKADGRPREFFVGKSHFELYPNTENQEIFQRVVATGIPFSVYEKPFEYPEHPERGVTYWDWSVQPVMGLDGAVEGIVLSLLDVTERVRAQAQQKATEERLRTLSRRLVEIQENERLYISRELHDEVGQLLTLLRLDLVTLESQAYQPQAVLKKVADMEKTLNAISESLRNVALALRPASLDHLGLVPALRQHLESIGERYKLETGFESGEFQERLPANIETELYRIAQEALTNIVRHAQASRVDMTLTVRDKKLIVMIADDGTGFDPEKVPDTGHLGLFSMRERAEMIGGQFLIESKPGKGTTVMVKIAYDNPASHQE
ncbi:MAG TPA: PAS domain-containing protein [Anaerolineales bacterium]|nr:PAS domain-containing protein [Anaerolineales bacterium]